MAHQTSIAYKPQTVVKSPLRHRVPVGGNYFPSLQLWPSLSSDFSSLKEFLQSSDLFEKTLPISFKETSALKVVFHSGAVE